MPESYQAVARIRVEREALPNTPGAAESYDPYFIQTEFEVIQSEVILSRVVQKLQLEERWGKAYNGGVKLPGSQTVVLLRRQLELRPVRNTSLIEIRAFSEQPDEAARIANAIAEAFQNYRSEQHARLVRDAAQHLQNELAVEDTRITAAQQELERLRAELNLSASALQESRDPALADTRERPFWQKKRELDDLVRYRNELASQRLAAATQTRLPQSQPVEIVDRAEPALRPVRPNVPLNLMIGTAAGVVLGVLAGGVVSLLSFRWARWVVIGVLAAILIPLGIILVWALWSANFTPRLPMEKAAVRLPL
jgi:uncharacterized protein involved in exopolysaccharide biosynthesis